MRRVPASRESPPNVGRGCGYARALAPAVPSALLAAPVPAPMSRPLVDRDPCRAVGAALALVPATASAVLGASPVAIRAGPPIAAASPPRPLGEPGRPVGAVAILAACRAGAPLPAGLGLPRAAGPTVAPGEHDVVGSARRAGSGWPSLDTAAAPTRLEAAAALLALRAGSAPQAPRPRRGSADPGRTGEGRSRTVFDGSILEECVARPHASGATPAGRDHARTGARPLPSPIGRRPVAAAAIVRRERGVADRSIPRRSGSARAIGWGGACTDAVAGSRRRTPDLAGAPTRLEAPAAVALLGASTAGIRTRPPLGSASPPRPVGLWRQAVEGRTALAAVPGAVASGRSGLARPEHGGAPVRRARARCAEAEGAPARPEIPTAAIAEAADPLRAGSVVRSRPGDEPGRPVRGGSALLPAPSRAERAGDRADTDPASTRSARHRIPAAAGARRARGARDGSSPLGSGAARAAGVEPACPDRPEPGRDRGAPAGSVSTLACAGRPRSSAGQRAAPGAAASTMRSDPSAGTAARTGRGPGIGEDGPGPRSLRDRARLAVRSGEVSIPCARATAVVRIRGAERAPVDAGSPAIDRFSWAPAELSARPPGGIGAARGAPFRAILEPSRAVAAIARAALDPAGTARAPGRRHRTGGSRPRRDEPGSDAGSLARGSLVGDAARLLSGVERSRPLRRALARAVRPRRGRRARIRLERPG